MAAPNYASRAGPPAPVAYPIASPIAALNPLLDFPQSLRPRSNPHTAASDPLDTSLAADSADSGIATGAWNVLPTSELGHPANRDKPYPLTLVPFDIANPPQHEQTLIIRPYDDIVSRYKLRDYWVEEYEAGGIGEGVQYEDRFVLPYLHSFYQDLQALKGLKARRGERLQIFPTTFTTSVRLDLDICMRPQDTVKDTLDGNDVEAKGARKRIWKEESASIVTSTTAESRMPDVGLVGYHLEQIADQTSQKTPGEEPSTKRSSMAQISTGRSERKFILYSINQIKWSPMVENVRDEAERRHLDDINLRYARLDALFQTLYHLHNAYRVAGCRLAIAWANEFFTRMVNVTGKCGPQRILVEASPKSISMASKRLPNCAAEGLSLDDLATLVHDDDWEAPNALIRDHDNWHYNEEAKYRLDATVLMTLAIATRATLGDVVASGGWKRGREVDHDEYQESPLPSKRPRYAKQGVDDDGFVGSVNDVAYLPTQPESGNILRPPSRPASSPSVASSALSPNKTDGTASVIDEALLELEFPSEDWSHGDYADALGKTGTKVVLVDPQQMDVLLARAAGQGWAEALKTQ
ncbi:hypothetical protein L202_08435 [Cryptococcus amylolentus CBS 6039]|uniref:Uncharacterized protein n=1 Tax=Cryptococcus amylolentus CBS 6039 TaxID=1295533 RepID=A0A1E3H9P9_9TREE|nr:hypothetical protein L202_08435 [Cryptococcus amylolentus CBS 6039]ODN73040.1 hypothetical protein L202_08435 [Cryptococcus amylolentus CBS 6039]